MHDGTIICSSFFMLEYISEALPGAPLMPTDAYDAYRARAWGQYLGAHLGSIVPVLGAAKYLRPHLAALDSAWVDRRIAAIEPIERRAGWLALRDGTYSAGYLQAVIDRWRRLWRGSRRRCRQGRGSRVRHSPWPTSTPTRCFACCRIWRRRWSMRNATPRITEYLERIAAREIGA